MRAAALLLLAVAGCGGAPEAPRPQAASEPRRIVSLAPSVTEVLFDLGLGERVVGVDDYSRWPPAVAEKPRLGGLFDPHLEAIARLEPDLAVMLPSQRGIGDQLAELGIDTLVVGSDLLADVEAATRAIAARCGVGEAGEAAVARLRRGLAPAPLATSPSVALVVGREPGRLGSVLVAGPGTFLDELLPRMGAQNAFADVGQPYPQVGLEEFLARQPSAIVELWGEPLEAEAAAALEADWRRIGELDRTCIAVVSGSEILVPGPRLPRVYRRLRDALAGCP